MATTKASGTTKLGRDSQPQYLGVKLYEGQKAKAGSIIIRQRGSKVLAGVNVKKGSDDTLFSLIDGLVKFSTRRKKGFDGRSRVVKVVSVNPIG